jgi:superfamily II DNA or RNA helicase
MSNGNDDKVVRRGAYTYVPGPRLIDDDVEAIESELSFVTNESMVKRPGSRIKPNIVKLYEKIPTASGVPMYMVPSVFWSERLKRPIDIDASSDGRPLSTETKTRYPLRDTAEFPQVPAKTAVLEYWETCKRENRPARCLLNMCTGSGKTLTAASTSVAAGRCVLVLCHLTVVFDQQLQWYKNAFPELCIGAFGGGKDDMVFPSSDEAAALALTSTSAGTKRGRKKKKHSIRDEVDVLVALIPSIDARVRTLVKSGCSIIEARVRVAEYLDADRWGTVVMDECHHCPARSFMQATSLFPGARSLYCTGTPNREDEIPIHWVAGRQVFEHKPPPGMLAVVPIILHGPRDDGYTIPKRWDGMRDMNRAWASLCARPGVSGQIAKFVAFCVHQGRSVLVFTSLAEAAIPVFVSSINAEIARAEATASASSASPEKPFTWRHPVCTPDNKPIPADTFLGDIATTKTKTKKRRTVVEPCETLEYVRGPLVAGMWSTDTSAGVEEVRKRMPCFEHWTPGGRVIFHNSSRRGKRAQALRNAAVSARVLVAHVSMFSEAFDAPRFDTGVAVHSSTSTVLTTQLRGRFVRVIPDRKFAPVLFDVAIETADGSQPLVWKQKSRVVKHRDVFKDPVGDVVRLGRTTDCETPIERVLQRVTPSVLERHRDAAHRLFG